MKNKILTAVLLTFTSYTFAQLAPQLGKHSAKEVIAAMTLEEKVNFLSGVGMGQTNPDEGPVAGSIEGKVHGAAGASVAIERLGISSVIFADGPAGLRISPVAVNDKLIYPTAYPIGSLLSSTWNKPLVEKVGKAIGNEAREFGVDVLLAPGMNIQRDVLCGRNFEYYSEDPVVSGNIAAAYVNGVQHNNVGTSIKHFAVNNQETNRSSINAVVGQRALREIYLKGFEIAVKKSQPLAVMSAYNKLNGVYTSESYDLLTTILRNEWGFKGVVISDWYAGRNYDQQVKAGNDLLMPGRKQETKKINEALLKGTISVEELDRNIEKILNLILETPTFQKYEYSNFPDFENNRKIARLSAAEGMILLKNDRNALPVTGKKIALLGNASYDTFTGGTGSGEVNAAYKISFYDGLKSAGFQIDETLKNQYISHIDTEKSKRPKRNNILEAIKPVAEFVVDAEQIKAMARDNDAAIITIGRSAGEAADRSVDTDYEMQTVELDLIKTTADEFHKKGKKVIVALNIDALMDVSKWRDLVDGIIITWLPGQEAGHAFADIVSGKVSPSGHLAQTLPLNYSDVPSSTTFPGEPVKRPKNSIYNEGIYVGYRYYTTFNKPVAYEFGYGLSYTTFTIDKLKASSKPVTKELKLSVDVKNTGTTDGKEVVQVYISAPGKTMEKPLLELKAFAKTENLKPGKSQKIDFTIHAEDLASFDASRSMWVVEPGSYTIKVGNSSKNILQKAAFVVEKEIVVEKVNDVLKPETPLEEMSQNDN